MQAQLRSITQTWLVLLLLLSSALTEEKEEEEKQEKKKSRFVAAVFRGNPRDISRFKISTSGFVEKSLFLRLMSF